MTKLGIPIETDPEELFMRWYEGIMLGWPEDISRTGEVIKRGAPMRYKDYYPEKLKNLYYAIPEEIRVNYQKKYANLCSICKNSTKRSKEKTRNKCLTPTNQIYKGSSVLTSLKSSSL